MKAMPKLLNGWLIAIVFILALPFSIFCEEEKITITVFYPSPYGSYNELVTNNLRIGAAYADIGITASTNGLIVEGNVGIGTSSPGNVKLAIIGGNVGIGTENPITALDVGEGIKIGDDDSNCDDTKEGVVRYHDGELQYCSSMEWKSAMAIEQQHAHFGSCQEVNQKCRLDVTLVPPGKCVSGSGCACEPGYTLVEVSSKSLVTIARTGFTTVSTGYRCIKD